MYTNFRVRFRGKEFKDMVWDAARSSYEAALTKSLKVIEEKSQEAIEWLKDRPYTEWCRAHFKTTACCDILTNNLCECFNRYILDSRDKAIITMLEMIRTRIMRRMFRKREELKRVDGPLCPKIKKKLDKIKDMVWAYTPLFARSPNIQVAGPDGQKVVDLRKHEYSFRRWQLIGIPCAHVVACIIGNNEDPVNYVRSCYSVKTALEVYKFVIPGINGPELWPHDNGNEVIAPSTPIKVRRGRKQKARRKGAEDIEKAKAAQAEKQKLSRKGLVKMKCSHCGALGHNVRYHGSKVQAQYAAKNKKKSTTAERGTTSTFNEPATSTATNNTSSKKQGERNGRGGMHNRATESIPNFDAIFMESQQSSRVPAKGICINEGASHIGETVEPRHQGKGKGKMPVKKMKK